ncbi:MAG: hypothetical protein ACRD1P_04395 [Thermoanaerobaculia bacterium]
MTHEEYLSRLDDFSDSTADLQAVLAHATSCKACRREQRLAERVLSWLDPPRQSRAAGVGLWIAAAAVLVVIGIGLRQPSSTPAKSPDAKPQARYRVVGDSSGVVAYTPGGVVVGTAVTSYEKGVIR